MPLFFGLNIFFTIVQDSAEIEINDINLQNKVKVCMFVAKDLYSEGSYRSMENVNFIKVCLLTLKK